MINIGLVLRELRIMRGLTQEDLSEESGMSVCGIRRIETCKRQPNSTSVYKIANALGVWSVLERDFNNANK